MLHQVFCSPPRWPGSAQLSSSDSQIPISSLVSLFLELQTSRCSLHGYSTCDVNVSIADTTSPVSFLLQATAHSQPITLRVTTVHICVSNSHADSCPCVPLCVLRISFTSLSAPLSCNHPGPGLLLPVGLCTHPVSMWALKPILHPQPVGPL